MNREIKFRAWSIDLKVMLSPEDDIAYEYQITANGDFRRDGMSCDVILMQYTGLKDSKGIEIYEGDICRNERGEIGKIVFTNGAFYSEYLPPHNWDPMEPADGKLGSNQEVIGNIYETPYETPELLTRPSKE